MIKFLTLLIMAAATLVELAFYADPRHRGRQGAGSAVKFGRRRERNSGRAHPVPAEPTPTMAAAKF